MSCDYVARPLG